jgi:hypothetical protein
MVSIPLVWPNHDDKTVWVRTCKTPDLPDYITRGADGAQWSGDNYQPRRNVYHIYIPLNPDNPAGLSGQVPIEYCNSDWYILRWLGDSYYTNPGLVISKGNTPLGHHTYNPALTNPCQSIAIEVDPESPIAGPSVLSIEVVRLKFGLLHNVCKSCQVIALDQLPEARGSLLRTKWVSQEEGGINDSM